jgi:EPS-associated MarR family transcriptional regulator
MDESHYRLLRLLQSRPQLTQRELAQEMGVSLGKVNYCIGALIEKGWIKARNFRKSNNKLAYAYLLTPRGVEQKAAITLRFLQRKIAEYESLKREIAELRGEVAIGRQSIDMSRAHHRPSPDGNQLRVKKPGSP